ncbi:MAG: DUF1080 domain-containing protein [Chitinophagaceae bacterium]|nr:MAG: DUF1080 domain-containing protein [Chitinophagaceae bacterium]
MKHIFALVFFISIVGCVSSKKTGKQDGWIPLFDGKSMTGWKVNENDSTFAIEDGAIKVNGKVSHLFYDGPIMNHEFRNFEFKAKVMTRPGSNSGIYFHTVFKARGFPSKGYEVQVNNSHTDWRRTGSLYAVADVRELYTKDDTWFTEYISVQGKRIIIKINDSTVVDYTEPEGIETTKGRAEKRIGTGTFALQGHDPNSKVFYKDIYVKPLPD